MSPVPDVAVLLPVKCQHHGCAPLLLLRVRLLLPETCPHDWVGAAAVPNGVSAVAGKVPTLFAKCRC